MISLKSLCIIWSVSFVRCICSDTRPRNRRSLLSQSVYLWLDDVIWRSSAAASARRFLHRDLTNLCDTLLADKWPDWSENVAIRRVKSVDFLQIGDPAVAWSCRITQISGDSTPWYSSSVSLISQQWHQWFHCAFISVLISLFHSMEAGSTFCIYQIFVVPPLCS